MFADSMTERRLNALFISTLRTGNISKVAQGITENLVRVRLRERGVFRRIIPPQYVDATQLQRSTDSDTLFALVDIEPLQSNQAYIATFGGVTQSQQVFGKKALIPFFMVSSPEFNKTEAELLAYTYSVTKLIEDNTIKDIEEKEDVQGMKLTLSAISGDTANRFFQYTGTPNKQVISDLVARIDSNMKTGDVATLLMHKATFTRLFGTATINDLGLDLTRDVFINGYKHPTLLGYNYLVTKKATIINPDNDEIYAFATPNYLGRFYLLGDAKFEIRMQRGVIYWSAWEHVAMAIVNPNSVAMASKAATPPSPAALPYAETGQEVPAA